MYEHLASLQETFEHEIPLTRALGLRVDGFDDDTLVLTAPLAPNINHKHTAFAGSINAVVTLAGWGILWLIVADADMQGQIVIQDSEIRYLRPVKSDFTARCPLPNAAEVQTFMKVLQRKGRARLELSAEVWSDGQVCATFHGRYVVHLVAPAAS